MKRLRDAERGTTPSALTCTRRRASRTRRRRVQRVLCAHLIAERRAGRLHDEVRVEAADLAAAVLAGVARAVEPPDHLRDLDQVGLFLALVVVRWRGDGVGLSLPQDHDRLLKCVRVSIERVSPSPPRPRTTQRLADHQSGLEPSLGGCRARATSRRVYHRHSYLTSRGSHIARTRSERPRGRRREA